MRLTRRNFVRAAGALVCAGGTGCDLGWLGGDSIERKTAALLVDRAADDRATLLLGLLDRLAELPCAEAPVTEQLHALQAASRALHADSRDEEVVVAALFHDVGSLLGEPHAVAAEMLLEPFVRDDVARAVRHHTLFRRRFAPERRHADAYRAFVAQPWFELAMRFTADYDQPSFDPTYETLSAADFEPIVRRVIVQRYTPAAVRTA